MNVYKINLFKCFIHTAFILVWSSILFSFVVSLSSWFDNSFINLGGNHGKYVVKRLMAYIGTPGLLLALLISAIFYLIYVSSKTIQVIRGMLRLNLINKVRDKYREHKEESPSSDNSPFVDETQKNPLENIEQKAVVYEDPKTTVLDFVVDNNASDSTVSSHETSDFPLSEDVSDDTVDGDADKVSDSLSDDSIGLEIVDTAIEETVPEGDISAPMIPSSTWSIISILLLIC